MTFPSHPTPATLAAHLAERFDEEELPYAFGGALALGVWGVPRTTSDVDVAVFVQEFALDRAFQALERAGAIVDRDDARRAVTRTGMFVADLAGTRIDVFIAHHPVHVDMERRRATLASPQGKPLCFLSAEDVVLTKLIYARAKDVSDLQRLFAVQGPTLDTSYVAEWLDRIVIPPDHRRILLADLIKRFGPGRAL